MKYQIEFFKYGWFIIPLLYFTECTTTISPIEDDTITVSGCDSINKPKMQIFYTQYDDLNWIVGRPINVFFHDIQFIPTYTYKWFIDPIDAAKLEVIDSINAVITPTREGKLNILMKAVANDCESEAYIRSNIVTKQNEVSAFDNTKWVGNIEYYSDYIFIETSKDTFSIKFIDLHKFVPVKLLEHSYHFTYFHNSDLIPQQGPILKFRASGFPGPSQKNGTPTITIDLQKKEIEYEHCTYYGNTYCTYGHYRML